MNIWRNHYSNVSVWYFPPQIQICHYCKRIWSAINIKIVQEMAVTDKYPWTYWIRFDKISTTNEGTAQFSIKMLLQRDITPSLLKQSIETCFQTHLSHCWYKFQRNLEVHPYKECGMSVNEKSLHPSHKL